MNKTRFVIIALLCVGLASAADARQKGHRHRAKHGKAKHHTAAKTKPNRPARPAPAPPAAPATTSAPLGHHTISPNVESVNSPGVWTYGATLSSGTILPGDGFTIFDFGGYVDNSIFAPAGWTAVAQKLGSVLGVPAHPAFPDNPNEFNLLFTFTGPPTQIGPQHGMQTLGEFGATTTSTSTTFVSWSSRDHFPTGNPPAAGTDHSDIIEAPAPVSAVPDGGATVALLGIGLTGLEAMRRTLRARKA